MSQGGSGRVGFWRKSSLRTKVTGVTVAVLALGLVAAGFGTMIFLRTTLISNLNTTLMQLAQSSAMSSLIDTKVSDAGVVSFTPKQDAVPTQWFLALYDGQTGNLVVTAGGSESETVPQLPATFPLAQGLTMQGSVFDLPGSQNTTFHATVVVSPMDGTNKLYTQLIAMPLSPTEHVVTLYLGIYAILALAIVVTSAFAVRGVLTLAFRSLAQVQSTAEIIASGDFRQRMTDIEPPTTEVGRLKRAINTMLARLDSALDDRDATVRQMRRFIGDASHELRTPLVTVRGYAELYRMGAIPDSEQVSLAFERIEKEAMRMGAMVEDLLALARLDERRELELVPLDLRPLAQDAALDVNAAAPERQVTVSDTTAVAGQRTGPSTSSATADPHPSPTPPAAGNAGRLRRGSLPTGTRGLLRRRPRTGDTTGPQEQPSRGSGEAITTPPVLTMPPIVLGEENKVRQVIANLLGNAQRFSPPETPIEIRVGTDMAADVGWIEVIDHGIGIPEQIRDKVFERFWRADNSRTRETGGSGLGLSIVASIVEALRGQVEVSETDGGGATFRVSLPLAAGRHSDAHLLIDTQPLPRLSQK